MTFSLFIIWLPLNNTSIFYAD